jgi:hypothetical protein
MKQEHPADPPMTLGNMRELGVHCAALRAALRTTSLPPWAPTQERERAAARAAAEVKRAEAERKAIAVAPVGTVVARPSGSQASRFLRPANHGVGLQKHDLRCD